jgi:hypothetical protein
MMATDAAGRLLWCAPLAKRAIARLAPDWDHRNAALPPQLRGGVQRLLAQHDPSGAPIRVEQPGAR